MSQHGHQGDDPRASRDEQEGPAHPRLPDEVPTDRPAELQRVTRAQLTYQVRGHFAIGESLHREHEATILGRRRDRVAALGLVSVFRGQADVNVLAGQVARPVRDVQDDASHSWGLVDELDDLAEHPIQSPAYRCSRHGSPYMW
jgi:hypothetical protein